MITDARFGTIGMKAPYRWLSYQYVVEHKTKPQSRGWKCLCPLCGGDDCWYTPDNHFAFCFNCGSSFRVESPSTTCYTSTASPMVDVQQLRSYYTELQDVYCQDIPPEVQAYLQQRSIDTTMVATYRIGYCPYRHLPVYNHPLAVASGILDHHRRPFLRNRIVFPYIAFGSVTDMRGRSVDPAAPQRYLSLPGRANERGAQFAYNYDRAAASLDYAARYNPDNDVLLVTEGEIKALFADAHGFAAVALPGMQSMRAIPPARRIVLVFDTDSRPEVQYATDTAIDRFVHHMRSMASSPSIAVVVLPLLDRPKMDIDTFLLHPKGGYTIFRRLVEDAIPYERYKQLRRF
ncbi:MAG: hypothetical protein D6823_03250 [Chloroflexi bacterium]|nr:MAG: hypothetical protein D6823_03250 [Chloroflexota bacterium]